MPDSFVECRCCGAGVVEVECPFMAKDSTINNYAEMPKFSLYKHADESLSLKEEHPYYYQCQLQLYISHRETL